MIRTVGATILNSRDLQLQKHLPGEFHQVYAVV